MSRVTAAKVSLETNIDRFKIIQLEFFFFFQTFMMILLPLWSGEESFCTNIAICYYHQYKAHNSVFTHPASPFTTKRCVSGSLTPAWQHLSLILLSGLLMSPPAPEGNICPPPFSDDKLTAQWRTGFRSPNNELKDWGEVTTRGVDSSIWAATFTSSVNDALKSRSVTIIEDNLNTMSSPVSSSLKTQLIYLY